MKNFYLLFILCSFVLNCRCSSGSIKSVSATIAMVDSIFDLVEEFTDLAKEISTHITNVVDKTEEGIKNNETKSDIAIFWENYWKSLDERYKTLQEKFNLINTETENYLNELDSNNQRIVNPELKKEDAEKTRIKRQEWRDVSTQTYVDLQNAKKMIDDGKDYLNFLKNEIIRDGVDSSIAELSSISMQAKSLSEDARKFEKSIKKIFNIKKK